MQLSRATGFDAAEMIALAEQATGFSDWGGMDIQEPLDWLCQALETEACLNSHGRAFAHSRISLMLRNRLQLVAARKADSRITEQQVRRPIIIPGLPRSGTTFLFNLLAQDPVNRSPLAWEIFFPMDLDRLDEAGIERRKEQTQQLFKTWGQLNPEVIRIHEFNAVMPEECPTICETVLQYTAYGAFWFVPSYSSRLAELSRVLPLQEHRKFLQHLQALRPAASKTGETRWLLKSPAHLADLPALHQVYPDAVYVQTHRDVAKVLPSYLTLYEALRQLSTDEKALYDPGGVLDQLVNRLSQRLASAAAFRATEEGRRLRFIDVLYADMLRDPIGIVRRIYEQMETELSAEVEERIGAWLRQNKQGKYGRNRYSAAEMGVGDNELKAAFGDYMARYNIPREGAAS